MFRMLVNAVMQDSCFVCLYFLEQDKVSYRISYLCVRKRNSQMSLKGLGEWHLIPQSKRVHRRACDEPATFCHANAYFWQHHTTVWSISPLPNVFKTDQHRNIENTSKQLSVAQQPRLTFLSEHKGVIFVTPHVQLSTRPLKTCPGLFFLSAWSAANYNNTKQNHPLAILFILWNVFVRKCLLCVQDCLRKLEYCDEVLYFL